jgi:hypothetical protein
MVSNAKEQVQRVLQGLPEDCSLEDVQYHLYVVEKIRNRLDAAERKHFVPQNQVEERLAKWLMR